MYFIALLSILLLPLYAYEPLKANWNRDIKIEKGLNRSNIFNLNTEDFEEYKYQGQIHASQYPVEVSGLFIPYYPFNNFFEKDHRNPITEKLKEAGIKGLPFSSMDEMFKWLGLNTYNSKFEKGIYKIPNPNEKLNLRMGAGIVSTKWGEGLTFSCTTCHSMKMFGKTVFGLTNKVVRANEFFELAKKGLPFINSHLFQYVTEATEQERLLFKRSKQNIRSVGVKKPQVLGLDTSLAQVGLSLMRRSTDSEASKSKFYEMFPRPNALNKFVVDSKPAVWWNLKYKTRWLSDGSIVQGNPIFTNILWNEIGRGTNLNELEIWMKNNRKKIDELTVAAFSASPPHWTDFFPADSIDLPMAMSGEKLYLKHCKECHGEYQKNWSLPDSTEFNSSEILKTYKVIYPEQTPVKDMGTDPNRYIGMKYFANELNNLKISKWMNTKIEIQKGYVPPPLDGIWARYPYLHNNSIPSLCALLTRVEDRPQSFYQGPANNPNTDFDSKCVGYPLGKAIPKSWKKKNAFYDTSKPGLRNIGHTKAFINEDGSEKLSSQEKMEIIEFLKTL